MARVTGALDSTSLTSVRQDGPSAPERTLAGSPHSTRVTGQCDDKGDLGSGCLRTEDSEHDRQGSDLACGDCDILVQSQHVQESPRCRLELPAIGVGSTDKIHPTPSWPLGGPPVLESNQAPLGHGRSDRLSAPSLGARLRYHGGALPVARADRR